MPWGGAGGGSRAGGRSFGFGERDRARRMERVGHVGSSGWGVDLVRCDARGASGGRPRDARGVDEGRIRGSGLTSPCAQPHRGSRDSPCDPSPPTNPARQPRPAATHFFIPPRSAAAAAAAATAASGRSSDAPSRRGNSDRRAKQALVSSGTLDAPGTDCGRGGSDRETRPIARRRRGGEIPLVGC